MSWQVINADAITGMHDIPDESVQACVTSPPYWGLRDYGFEGQIGKEPTLEEYIWNLLEVFREVWRVLRPDGTLWLNLGDAFVTRPRGNDNGWDKSRLNNPGRVQKAQIASLMNGRDFGALKPKDLIGVPWAVAFALRADGWWLRNDNIWNKPNPMPESVGDRCSRSHEYVFQFNKAPRYYYDGEAIREPATHGDNPRNAVGPVDRGQPGAPPHRGLRSAAGRPVAYGRQKRTVWTVSTVPYKPAHFACFPPKLIEPCILASTPPQCCAECGAPWERRLEKQKRGDWNPNGKSSPSDVHRSAQANGKDFYEEVTPPKTLGWDPSCECAAPGGASMVLDPFAGSGVTGMVALRHGRSFIGIEGNAEYVELARRRITDDAPLMNQAAEAIA